MKTPTLASPASEGIDFRTSYFGLNRDLRFLAQILKQAEQERYIARNPFDSAKFFLNESRERKKPHILTWEEQENLLTVAPPRIRVLTVLGVETGMRTGEMLSLRWNDIDFLNGVLRVEKSKSAAGIRSVPLSGVCKSELLRWRSLVGPEFSGWVFPTFTNHRHRLQGGRKAWASALKKAGIPFFPIYNLRHTFASRMTAAGVSPITVAQMLGHASTQIVPRYAQVLDQNRFDAMKKLESLRQSSNSNTTASETTSNNDAMPRTKQFEIALSTFEKIRAAFPALTMNLVVDDLHVDLAMDIPAQPGLAFKMDLHLQNLDELHLSASALWVEWFPCTKPEKVDRYFQAVSGLLPGEFRILKHWRGRRPVKAQLQRPIRGGWESVATWGDVSAMVPWPKKTFKVVQNKPSTQSP